MDLKHKVLFQVSLSNGQTFYEGKGQFIDIPGELSPWQRLVKYSIDNKLEITSLGLYTEDGRTFNLPSRGKSPKFIEFIQSEQPIDYHVERHISREHDIVNDEVKNTQVLELFTVAMAIYPTYKLQIWVDEHNPRNSWVLVVKK